MTWDLPIIDVALGLCAVVAAGCALLAGSRAAQVMGFLGLGILMTLVWLRLGSVDVALAEAGLGGGILGALLVWLAVRGPERRSEDGPLDAERPAHRTASAVRRILRLRAGLGVLAGAATAMVTAAAWLRTEQELPTWTTGLQGSIDETGVSHEVTGVLLAFRAYDTLLESAVLLFAAVAVLALGQGRGLDHVQRSRSSPASVLPWMARWIAPLVLLTGLWLLFAGSSDSGGAFQSGAVLSALLILLRTAQVPLDGLLRYALRPALVLGVVVFILVGLIGPLTGDAWLSWGEQWSFALILTVEITLTLGIAVALFVVYLGLESPAEDDGAYQHPAGNTSRDQLAGEGA